MNSTFRRELDQRLLDALKDGPLHEILLACRSINADVRLRRKEAHVYVRGNRIAALGLDRRRNPRLRLHSKYCDDTGLGLLDCHQTESERRFAVSADFVTHWKASLASVCTAARNAREGLEGAFEAEIVAANLAGTPVEIFDRQVQVPRLKRERLDMLGLTVDPATGKGAFVAIELKLGGDNRVQELPQQVQRYGNALAPRGQVRPDIIASYRNVVTQMRELGIPAPTPDRFQEELGMLALVVVVGKASAEQLRRAQRAAATVECRIGWVELHSENRRIESPEKWRWFE